MMDSDKIGPPDKLHIVSACFSWFACGVAVRSAVDAIGLHVGAMAFLAVANAVLGTISILIVAGVFTLKEE